MSRNRTEVRPCQGDGQPGRRAGTGDDSAVPGVAPAALRSYLRRNLVLMRLPRGNRFQVWCVSRSGRQYKVWERLPAGTPVFALATARRLLFKRVCGNPLVANLPAVSAAKVLVKHPSGKPRIAPPPVSEPAAPAGTPLRVAAPLRRARSRSPPWSPALKWVRPLS